MKIAATPILFLSLILDFNRIGIGEERTAKFSIMLRTPCARAHVGSSAHLLISVRLTLDSLWRGAHRVPPATKVMIAVMVAQKIPE